MKPSISPQLFSSRAKLKLRLILLATLLCQVCMFGVVAGMLAGALVGPQGPMVPELAHVSPWVYTALLIAGMLSLLWLVLLYARVYYGAEREYLERNRKEGPPTDSGETQDPSERGA